MTRPLTRREFLSVSAGTAAAAVLPRMLWAAAGPSAPVAKLRRPNIVLIMADDMGFSDSGCFVGEISTRNLDSLAAGGIRFTQFYNCARCCPTRASLLTGLYPHQAGVGHMVANRGLPSYQGYLNDSCVTIAEVLKQAGYNTLMSGKWHVGTRRHTRWPCGRGFDESYASIYGSGGYWKPNGLLRNDQRVDPEGDNYYTTDAFTNESLKYLDQYGRREEPFFLYVSYTAPHWPLHAWPEDVKKYDGVYDKGWSELRLERHKRMIEMGIVEERWKLSDSRARAWDPARDNRDMILRMAVYAAQIDRMDQGIGRIMAKLRELGLEENTLVLFLSDNGGCAERINRGTAGVPAGQQGSFLSYGLPWANLSNTPFRLYKHWVHEGGIATPLIAYWPDVIKQNGRIGHQPGHVMDIMATCVDVASADYPLRYKGRDITPLEGKSLLPIFRRKTRQGHEAIYWEHEGNRAVREGKWKLVRKRRSSRWELYDLEADRTETQSLSAEHPERVARMSEMYGRWAERCGVAPNFTPRGPLTLTPKGG